MKRLSENKSLNFALVGENTRGFNGQPWNMLSLSWNSKIDWDFVKANPDGFGGNWSSEILQWKEDLDWNLVESHPRGLKKYNMSRGWSTGCLSRRLFNMKPEEIFFGLPFAQPAFKEALRQHWAEMYYRPETKRGKGGPGYLSQIVEWSKE